jgi:hypothetical protein
MREVSELEEIVVQEQAESRRAELALFVAEERLAYVEQVLGYAGAAAHAVHRPLSVEGVTELRKLQDKAVRLITQKNRVQLLLEDFERSQERVAEADRSNVDHCLRRLRDLHQACEDVVSRMEEVLRAEEELVRQGFAADPTAFDRFAADVAVFDRQYTELRRRPKAL